MRILHLTSHLNVGGVSSAVLTLSKALIARGHQVTIASGGGQLASRAVTEGIAHWSALLHTSVEFSPQVFWAAVTLARRLREEPVDLLHAHTRVTQVVAAALSRVMHCPYVTTWHGFFRPNLGRKLWPCTGHATIAISQPVLDHVLTAFRVSSEQAFLIPHGVDPAPFEAPLDTSAQEQLRRRMGLSADAPLIGTIARLVESKGVHYLIHAMPRILEALPRAQLLIVGDGSARKGLERLVASLGMTKAVRFTGVLPETVVALSLMQVFVFIPAEEEGFGLALLEAMASGCPIVAVRRGRGAPWVLKEIGVGTLVEPGDLGGLAAAVVHLLRDRSRAQQEGSRARATLKERYTLDRMVGQVEAVYRRVLGGG